MKSRTAIIRKNKAWKRRSPKSACRVYVLRAEPKGPIFYVGQTRQAPSERLRWHMKGVHVGSSPVKRWLRALGAWPVIETLDANGVWDVTEAVWIDRLRTQGHPLLNVLSVVPMRTVNPPHQIG